MRKLMFVAGISALFGSLYLYFRKQLDLALSYDYDIRNIRFLTLNTQEAELEAEVKLTNKSAFEVEVVEYDLNIFFRDVNIARTFSTERFIIHADSFSTVKVTGSIDFESAKSAFLPFVQTVIAQHPIKISIDGYVKVKFIGFPYTIRFNKEEFEYSNDLLQEYGLDDNLQKLKDKLPFLKKL